MNYINDQILHQSKKKHLEELLTDEMQGIKRTPALLIPNIDNIGIIQKYEILPNEPMHDIAGHWKNLMEEIPTHLSKTEKKAFQDICLVGLNKDTKRAVDYRKTVIHLTVALKNIIPDQIYQLLLTCCEMQEILYAGEESRNASQILRYHLVSYKHACLLNDIIGKKPNTITPRKLYGKYYHALIRHAGHQLRLISGKSSHAEQEEREFNYLKSVAKLTTNHHPDNVSFNLWIRF